ncbi:MAG TPA: metal ABC transporter ATP-binding protein [Gammaproteobacteria bacterium]|nr:metal ABC transporter ATP-binding protein [Gammaproteobacteria bacterium]
MSLLLTLQDLAIGYGGCPLLSGIDLPIKQGEFWSIVGPNGAGKTTLIKTILGIIPPIRGRIERAHGLTFGYVPQRGVIDDIYPLTALEVVLMGVYPRVGLFKRVTRSHRELALTYMERVGVVDLAERPFRLLSGGQKQRTLIARGLAMEPDILILDEPTDGMDIAGEAGIMELMSGVRRQSGRTILMITHNLNVVANYAQHLMIMHGGEGLCIAGTTEELLSSQTLKDVYQLRVDVQAFAGRKFVFAQKASGTGMGERSWNS